MFEPCGNIRRKDSYGRFLLNARPKLNSNLNLNSKLICNQLSINDDMKFQIKDHELPINRGFSNEKMDKNLAGKKKLY